MPKEDCVTNSLSTEKIQLPNNGGYIFIRSDGQRFFMLPRGDAGNTTELYVGDDPNLPGTHIVTIQNFADPIARTLDHVLAYPDRLNDHHIIARI